jgi:hypothetical protein
MDCDFKYKNTVGWPHDGANISNANHVAVL